MLLAIDTSTRWVGLALYNQAQVNSEMVWQTQNHHTVELAPALENLLNRSGAKTSDLRALAVALGPGSFTSLRIGLGLVKGLSLALHIPIIGVRTMDIMAAAQPVREMPLAIVIQAGRGRVAVGWYSVFRGAWRSQEEALVMTVDDLSQQIHKPTMICGELTLEERQLLARKRKNVILSTPASSLRRPGYLAELGWKRWQAGKVDDPISLAPIYVHIAEAIPA